MSVNNLWKEALDLWHRNADGLLTWDKDENGGGGNKDDSYGTKNEFWKSAVKAGRRGSN